MACAPSEDSDQPGHPPSLIRVFAVRMKIAWVFSYPLSARRRLIRPGDAQVDLSLRWAHSRFVAFVARRLFFIMQCFGICYPASGPIFMSNSSHLSPLTLEVVGEPQMTLQKYLSILPCLPLPSGNLQTPFPFILWCYLPISSSVFLSYLLLSLSPAELCSPCQRILRCGYTIWVSVSLPWLGDHHAFQLYYRLCCEPPRSSHGLWRKCSEVSYSISPQGLGSFSQFLLSRSNSHRHKGR